MAFERAIEVDHAARQIYVTVTGRIDRDAYIAIAEEVVAIYTKNGYDVFYDVSQASLDRNLETLTEAPREIKGKDTQIAREISIAVYVPEADLNSWKFIELLYFGMGYPLKIFTDKSAALEWLRKEKGS